MKRLCSTLVLLLSVTSLGIGAETPTAPPPSANAAAPARRPPSTPPVRSPEVQTDHRVTFRLRAPKASEVVVAGQWPNGCAAMEKDTIMPPTPEMKRKMQDECSPYVRQMRHCQRCRSDAIGRLGHDVQSCLYEG